MDKEINMNKITTERPWGQFEQFTCNETTTVKILTINPNSSLSLQYHEKREEFWKVLGGNPKITIGTNIVIAKPGDEFLIHKLENHRIEATDNNVTILEIAYGDFDEEDIIRIEDIYGRS